jgi:two-component system sensor histidine kinase KdpD
MAADGRPDPDALLRRVREEEKRARRGRLRIYFGSSAGVGKTYAMLLAARKLKAEGVDVAVGIVETHGRGETAALLETLEVLPMASVEHRSRRLAEFDLDTALARRPALILVDELAHANVPGLRHPKRWQDVEELLAAGIDVYTTLNVQHLESLNDVVGGITGIRVTETLPDTFFDAADEVVLVDTPAEELLARLEAGKIYLPTQAERAARNFFRKGNLMALRELALRRTADRVEDDVQAYRSERAIEPVWKTEAALLCCIGPREGAEHVVRGAARLAQQLAVAWHAVYVETPPLQRLKTPVRERILETVKLAEELGATTSVLPAQDVAGALVDHARHHNLSKIVLGRNPARYWWRGAPMGRRIAERAKDVDLIELGDGHRLRTKAENEEGTHHRANEAGGEPWRRYALALAICAASTLVALPLIGVFELANIVMLFLLSVVAVAVTLGRGPAVLAAFVNVAAFDFFCVPPRLSFAVSDVEYLLTFFVMLVVGLVTGQLTAGLRYQARVATHREARSRALYGLARDLSNVLLTDRVVELAQQAVAREFHAQVAISVLTPDDRLQPPVPTLEGFDLGTARWALDHGEQAGLGTDTLPGSAWLYVPLKAPMRVRGVLGLKPEAARFLMVPEQRRQLETFAALTAMALERVHYVEVAQKATVQIESERLRNSLLAELSHDLRTPLAALVGLSDTLALSHPRLAAMQADLATAIREESLRMSDLVNNLLDMARIQSGEIRLRLEWQSMEELIGAAIQASRRVLGERRVTARLEAGLPLVECDAILIERVLGNLLENAAKFTPPEQPVEVSARVVGDAMHVSVADRGPGVPKGLEETIFEKFTRGAAESATPGVGLGLAICRAIVEAHRGRIWVEPAAPTGAVFSFALPLGTPPPLEPADEITPSADG